MCISYIYTHTYIHTYIYIYICVFEETWPRFSEIFLIVTCASQKKEFWAIKGDPLSQQSPERCANSEFLSWLLKAFKRSEDEIRLCVREESWLQTDTAETADENTKGQRVQQIGTKAMTLTWSSLCACVCVCVCEQQEDDAAHSLSSTAWCDLFLS